MEKLNKALIKVQSQLKAPKNQRNNFGKYNYRSAEDILEAVKPHLAANGLSMQISDKFYELVGIPYIETSCIISDGTDSITVTAQAGIDPNRKGMDIAQCFGASSSYARKYALNGMFLIDDTKDSDATNTHGANNNYTKSSTTTSASDTFQKAVDYIKAAKNASAKEIAYKQVIMKYGSGFSDKQKEALGKFVK